MKKILLLCPESSSVRNFRMGLIKHLLSKGCQVVVSSFDDECKDLVENAGAEFRCVRSSNRSLNPLSFARLKKEYISLIKSEKPDIVLTFVLKPNSFGTVAAKRAGVANTYCFVEGAGDVFINNSLKWRLIRIYVSFLYKRAFKIAKKVFFINNDDKNDFIERGFVTKEKCELIHGVGVDLTRFEYKELKKYDRFLMISRLLNTKGVIEYCEAAKTVKQKYPQATFSILGPEGTLKQSDIQSYVDEGVIEYLGATLDVRPYLEDCTVHVLPSYREGLGLVNAEAGAVGRAIITCDTIGTRDTVSDGYNGFLVPVKSSAALTDKMVFFIENKEEAVIMGKNARSFVEEHFDQKKINEQICEIIGI